MGIVWTFLGCSLQIQISNTGKNNGFLIFSVPCLKCTKTELFGVVFLLFSLFLAAHRDNDESSLNKIRKILDSIQERGVSLMTVKIGPISQDNVNTLVAELLCLPPRLSHPLSNVVHSKTGGVALFVLKFLESLNTEGLLWFSLTSRRW